MSEQKKFDVRKEMLARPNEWVGAYKGNDGNWRKVKFDYERMGARETLMSRFVTFSNFAVILFDLDECIPIEDVPEEEWK